MTRSLEFTARVAPVQQAELFFRADSHLSRLLVQRDEGVHEGDLLAELEMTDLQRQLEAAQLARENHGQKKCTIVPSRVK